MNSSHKLNSHKTLINCICTAMGIGPIDMVVLDINTGEYQAYDVKTANYRKSDYTPKDRYVRKGSL